MEKKEEGTETKKNKAGWNLNSLVDNRILKEKISRKDREVDDIKKTVGKFMIIIILLFFLLFSKKIRLLYKNHYPFFLFFFIFLVRIHQFFVSNNY